MILTRMNMDEYQASRIELAIVEIKKVIESLLEQKDLDKRAWKQLKAYVKEIESEYTEA